MTDYLLAGLRHRPGVKVRHRGPFATVLLPPDEALLVSAATTAALASDWPGARSRDRFVLRVFDGREVRRLVEAPRQVHVAGPVPALFKLVWHLTVPALSAAGSLAQVCDLVASAQPDLDGRGFLEALGQQAAGITPGRAGWVDLATGGRNTLLGDGFRPELDDGTHKQVRHFAGTAAAAARMGSATTRVASRLRGDLPGTADDRLSAAAIEFAHDLRHGVLAPSGAGAWVRRRLVLEASDGAVP